jgi:AraC family transcriptional regulator
VPYRAKHDDGIRPELSGVIRARHAGLREKGATVIAALNQLVDFIESHLSEEIDTGGVASSLGTTEYHLRRMFSSLAGMPLSEYIRRRRMTVAAGDVVGADSMLDIAVRYGYGSTEAFGRAFLAVHGVSPGEVRRKGGPLRAQPKIRFRLTVEGNTTMDARIMDRPAFRLVGHAARVPLIHQGANPHIQAHIASLPATEHARLKELCDTEPSGLLQVSADVAPDYTEGSELTYLHGVAVEAETRVPEGLDVIDVPGGTWVAFRSSGPYPAALQATWASTATEWFPSNPWRLRPGPSIVAVLDRADDFSSATTELWMPIERA